MCSGLQGDPRTPTEVLRDRQGFATNTFLIINKACVDSILDQRLLDDMRILVFEPIFLNRIVATARAIEGGPGSGSSSWSTTSTGHA